MVPSVVAEIPEKGAIGVAVMDGLIEAAPPSGEMEGEDA